MSNKSQDVLTRITDYLVCGGLVNSEMMQPQQEVSNLILDCRNIIEQQSSSLILAQEKISELSTKVTSEERIDQQAKEIADQKADLEKCWINAADLTEQIEQLKDQINGEKYYGMCKDDTATTFMNQVKKLQTQVAEQARTIAELRRDKERLDCLEGQTDGCANSIVLVHNFSRYGSCRATLDHMISIGKDARNDQ